MTGQELDRTVATWACARNKLRSAQQLWANGTALRSRLSSWAHVGGSFINTNDLITEKWAS